MGASTPSKTQTLIEVESALRVLLPPQWTLKFDRDPTPNSGRRPDAIMSIATRSSERAVFVAEVKREPTAGQIRDAIGQLRSFGRALDGAWPLVIGPWLSGHARKTLADQGVSYADATGNVRLLAERPGLFVSGVGAAKNPWPVDKTLQSLRGKGSARAVRALVDFMPPYGVRELAQKTSASAATLSRVTDLLEREGLVERDDRGRVASLDWAGTIRRWVHDYDVLRTNEAASYLQPRGLAALTDMLGLSKRRYALTGSFAMKAFAPIAPAKLAMVYVDDRTKAASEFDLRPTDVGANVMLLEPYDAVVFERGIEPDGPRLVNPTQLAADLLTGPGRSPSEGEELLAWMEDNSDVWRA